MPNAKRKCPRCGEYNRIEDGYLNKSRNRLFCNSEHSRQYELKGSISAETKRGLDFLAKREKRERQKKRDEVKGLKHWIKVTQRDFNAYILVRDADLPCISCGIHNHEISCNSLRGSEWHAGHFLSVGSHPELRLNAKNVNKQCSICNAHLSSNRPGYEQGIVARFGQDRLDWLLGPHDQLNATIEYLARFRKVINKRKRMILSRRGLSSI